MKKLNLIKVVTILLISVMVMLFATTVNAADDNEYIDRTNELLDQLKGDNTSNQAGNTKNNQAGNTNNATNNTNKSANNTNNAVNNTNKSSVYNNTNTNLPKTGIEDSIPVAILVVVFGISAVYAYKKVNDYKNI